MVYFQTKNPTWVQFGGPWNGKKCGYGFEIFLGHLVYFSRFGMVLKYFWVIWYIFPVLV
jgi:hypothetical protein